MPDPTMRTRSVMKNNAGTLQLIKPDWALTPGRRQRQDKSSTFLYSRESVDALPLDFQSRFIEFTDSIVPDTRIPGGIMGVARRMNPGKDDIQILTTDDTTCLRALLVHRTRRIPYPHSKYNFSWTTADARAHGRSTFIRTVEMFF